MTKAVLPYFRERRAGHIIQVTSIGAASGRLGAHLTLRRSSESKASRNRYPRRSDLLGLR